ncbi:MAG: J domain-containing protein [Candidatus Endonucleobacter sp. (ex Gigantidas childressi)]|nr:J domain-containing protein [Candidatus Endonucleobacter sp. (ex Gigantidas childressi)]
MTINVSNLPQMLKKKFTIISDSTHKLGKFLHYQIASVFCQTAMLLKWNHISKHDNNHQTRVKPKIEMSCCQIELSSTYLQRNNSLEDVTKYKKDDANLEVIVCEEECAQRKKIDTHRNTHTQKDESNILTPDNLVNDLCLSLSISVPENITTEEKFKFVLRTKNLSFKKLNAALLEILENNKNLPGALKNLKVDVERKERNIQRNLISSDAKADMFFSSMLIHLRQALKETDSQSPPYKKAEHSSKNGGSHTYESKEKENTYSYKGREKASGFRSRPYYSKEYEQKRNAKTPSFESFYNDGNDFKGFSVQFPIKINSWLEDNCADGLSFKQISDRCVAYSDKDGLVKKVVIRRADDKFIMVNKEYVIKMNGDFYIKQDVDKERMLSFLSWEDKADFVDEVSEAWSTLSITNNKDKNKSAAKKALFRVHPDKNIGNEKQAKDDFQRLYKAYEVLQKHDLLS